MSRATMRIFVPATMADLTTLHESGELAVSTGYALTDRYRAAVGAEIADDDEVLDYQLMVAAADESQARQTGADSPRRVVLAIDLPAEPEPSGAAAGRVIVDGPVDLRDVASVHVEDAGSDGSDTDLLWYAPQELADLV